jgi:hypothetical protein
VHSGSSRSSSSSWLISVRRGACCTHLRWERAATRRQLGCCCSSCSSGTLSSLQLAGQGLLQPAVAPHQ